MFSTKWGWAVVVAVLVVAAIVFAPLVLQLSTNLIKVNTTSAMTSGAGGCCGGSGGAEGGRGPGRESAPVAAVCTITANKYEVAKGGKVTLSFTSRYGTSATISGVGAVSLNGSKAVTVNQSRAFVMTVVGRTGPVTCQTHVKVVTPQKPPQMPKPTCAIFADPDYINPGDSAKIWWTSTNANSASLRSSDGALSCAVAVQGARYVSPSTYTTYTLTVKGPGGTATCNTMINVKTPTPCDSSSGTYSMSGQGGSNTCGNQGW